MSLRPHSHHTSARTLFVAALGVVFGDIGTSPLYTLRECFYAAGLEVTPLNVLGILSSITWALTLVVTLKYVAIIMRADNRGEGGILALTALAIDQFAGPRQRHRILLLGLLGAALFYGDALITPAISVLSAVEGVSVITPAFQPYVIPIALMLLMGLFVAQRHGTAVVGRFFGPVMAVWFLALGALGVYHVIDNPMVLQAFNPFHAFAFAAHNPLAAFLTMGAVVLAVTGGEALYADMGHLGRHPIQSAWLMMVCPALMLNYFGQGAMLLLHPETLSNPFYLMVPEFLLVPMVILATMATIIASQAVISGAYSITHQAIQMGYLPRLEVRHTNLHNAGQIYIPVLNYLMLAGIVLLVLGFRSSSNLAGAYGIAVTGTMLLTTILATTVLSRRNRWHPLAAGAFAGTFLAIDGLFFTANIHKIPDGGWFPLALGLAIFFIMHTWLKGREVTHEIILKHTPPMESFLQHINPVMPHIRRTAVFLTSDLNHAPPALIYNITHNAVIHAQVIILKISRARIPRYPHSERISIRHHAHNISTVQATYGFMEHPNVPKLLAELPHYGLALRHPDALSYFISTHTYVPSPHHALNSWQEPIFVILDNLSQSAVSYFNLPRNQVIEIGNQIEI